MDKADVSVIEPQKKSNIGRIIFYAISTVVIVVLVLLLLTVIMTKKTGDPPAIFGHRLFIVSSNSMQPTIPAGSAILVKKVDADSLQTNDIITFKEGYDSNNNLVINTHKIVGINKTEQTTFVTRGDNNIIDDTKLRYPEDIYGKVVGISSGFGSFLIFLKSPLGLVICIALPLFLLLVVEVINLLKLNKLPKENFIALDEKNATLFGTHINNGKTIKQKSNRKLKDKDGEVEDNKIEVRGPVPNIRSTLYDTESLKQQNNQVIEKSQVEFEAEEPEKNNPDRILTKADDRKDGYDQGYKIKTKEEEQKILNNMNGFAFLRDKKIITKSQEEEEQIRVLEHYQNASRSIAVMTNSEQGSFNATMQSQGKDRFIIDGIDVRVQPEALHLGFDEESGREISITVTKEYTNVVVECKEYEINFALFKDENDEEDKVIIQRKNK